jgi:hypothetical protein
MRWGWSLADASECAARAGGSGVPDPLPLVYGDGFGMTVRFKVRDGDAPVLRVLWRRENGVANHVVWRRTTLIWS